MNRASGDSGQPDQNNKDTLQSPDGSMNRSTGDLEQPDKDIPDNSSILQMVLCYNWRLRAAKLGYPRHTGVLGYPGHTRRLGQSKI